MATATGSTAGSRRPKLLDRWLKRRTRLDLPLTLTYRQIFILPTRFGWMLGVLMGAMLIGSLNFNNNLGLLTTFIVAAIAQNSTLLAYRNLRGLKLGRAWARPVHAGETIPWQVHVRNPDERARHGLVISRGESRTVFEAPGESATSAVVSLPACSRGWHLPGRLRLETTQPLGLFRAWSWFEPTTPFLVWPSPAPNAPPLPRGGEAEHGQRNRAREEGEDFHSLRDWREGDPLHRIAWKASQRHRTLLSREFRREQSKEVHLSLERAPGRDREERIRILTAWVMRALAENRPWTLELGGERLGPECSETHKHNCLRALAEL